MKLWLLRPIDPHNGPWEPWYDKSFGFVVEADTEARARQIASLDAGDEKASSWLDVELTTCVELKPSGRDGVIMRDFASA